MKNIFFIIIIFVYTSCNMRIDRGIINKKRNEYLAQGLLMTDTNLEKEFNNFKEKKQKEEKEKIKKSNAVVSKLLQENQALKNALRSHLDAKEADLRKAEIDKYNQLFLENEEEIAKIQKKYADDTGILSKIKSIKKDEKDNIIIKWVNDIIQGSTKEVKEIKDIIINNKSTFFEGDKFKNKKKSKLKKEILKIKKLEKIKNLKEKKKKIQDKLRNLKAIKE